MNIYLDIDNTICKVDESHGKDKYVRAIPMHDKIARANQLYAEGNRITYWTARGKASGIDYSELTRKQLQEWGCKYHDLRMDKPQYDAFIDDKAFNTMSEFDKQCECCVQQTMSGIVQKGWGHECIIVNNEKYCGKILHFHKNARFSMHYHILKTETWYVYSGRFEFHWIDTKTAERKSKLLHVGDTVTNEIGQPHQLVCLEEGDIFEVSTQHFDSDSYRVFKGDSQKSDVQHKRIMFLMHLGLGDHIMMAPAVSILAKQTETLYIPCKSDYISSVQAVYANLGNIVLLPVSTTSNEQITMNDIHKHIAELGKDGQIAIVGTGMYTKNPHPVYPFPTGFYKDLGLDFVSCRRDFQFPTAKSRFDALLTLLKQLDIPHIFVHSLSSTRNGNEIRDALRGKKGILLNPDVNMYTPTDPYYYLAQCAIRVPDCVITEYIPMMESASELHLIDSCYFCISAFIKTNASMKTVYKRSPVPFAWLDSDSKWNEHVLPQ